MNHEQLDTSHLMIMSVARQSFVSPRRRRSRRLESLQLPQETAPRQARSNVAYRNQNQRVERLPIKRLSPIWLRSLLFLQRSSKLISLCLVGVTLILYAGTVYSQQRWSKEYRQLETLQRNERHLTATSEVIKNQLAQQAERPSTGFVPPNPANMLFIPPAPQRHTAAPTNGTSNPKPSPNMPLGY